MIILDTNVISGFMQDPPNPRIVAWLDRQPRSSLWTTAVSIYEIQSGIEVLPLSRRRSALSQVFESVLAKIEQRIAPFDEEAARIAANLTAVRQQRGRAIDLRDTMIAGIVLAKSGSLATRNVSHFSDISAPIINPWSPEEP